MFFKIDTSSLKYMTLKVRLFYVIIQFAVLKWLVEMVGRRFGNGNFSPTELDKLQVQAVQIMDEMVRSDRPFMIDIVVRCGLWETFFELLQQHDKEHCWYYIFSPIEVLLRHKVCRMDQRKIEIVASAMMTTDHYETLCEGMFKKY